MIRNENEYQEAARRLADERQRVDALTKRLGEEGNTDVEVNRLTDPMQSFHLQLDEEVDEVAAE